MVTTSTQTPPKYLLVKNPVVETMMTTKTRASCSWMARDQLAIVSCCFCCWFLVNVFVVTFLHPLPTDTVDVFGSIHYQFAGPNGGQSQILSTRQAPPAWTIPRNHPITASKPFSLLASKPTYVRLNKHLSACVCVCVCVCVSGCVCVRICAVLRG